VSTDRQGQGCRENNILKYYTIEPQVRQFKDERTKKCQPAKLLDNIPNRRQSLYELLDKMLWTQSKKMLSLVQ
jgi:hypothetical protein